MGLGEGAPGCPPCLLPGTESFPSSQCSLTGNWINDLGSNMTIEPVNDKGEFRGTYYTAVAATPNKITKSPLLGIQNMTVCQPTFGFTVGWTFIGASFPSSLPCPCSSAALPCDIPFVLLLFPTTSPLLSCPSPRCPHWSPPVLYGGPDDLSSSL